MANFQISYTTSTTCNVFGKMVYSQSFETKEELDREIKNLEWSDDVTYWIAKFADGTVIENGAMIDGPNVVYSLPRLTRSNYVDFIYGPIDAMNEYVEELGLYLYWPREIISRTLNRMEIVGGNENKGLKKVGEKNGVELFIYDN